MQFGVCGGIDVATIAAGASYDFAEWNVSSYLKPEEPEEAFHAGLDAVREAGVTFRANNCFVPGHLKITGPDVDAHALQVYVATTLARAEQAGVEVIVFGSGGARQIPDGFDRAMAWDQLIAFCGMVAPLAQAHGVTVVVEPLNKAECNVLTTVSECAALVNAVAHPAVRLLVDAYHFMRDGDAYEDIVTYGDLLAHVHIATVPNRLPPGAEPCDFSRFFRALADAAYTGRVSIEGKVQAPAVQLPVALAAMRELAH
jgi:sugar phosphate isomerase/epimerase